jgi:hypothetical protein
LSRPRHARRCEAARSPDLGRIAASRSVSCTQEQYLPPHPNDLSPASQFFARGAVSDNVQRFPARRVRYVHGPCTAQPSTRLTRHKRRASVERT